MANSFVHVELNTNDLAKAKTFYSNLFSWKLDDVPMDGGNLHDDQSGGRNRRRNDETNGARCAVSLARVCAS